MKTVEVIAHGGGTGHQDNRKVEPNTLSAIETALENSVDIIEIDVRRTRDGKLVLLHDPIVSRTLLGKGKVNKLNSQALKGYPIRNLNAMIWNKFRPIRWWFPLIPLLSIRKR